MKTLIVVLMLLWASPVEAKHQFIKPKELVCKVFPIQMIDPLSKEVRVWYARFCRNEFIKRFVDWFDEPNMKFRLRHDGLVITFYF